MVTRLLAQYRAWAADTSVGVILLRGHGDKVCVCVWGGGMVCWEGGRGGMKKKIIANPPNTFLHQAFCAGGDVKRVVAAISAGDTGAGIAFFRTEYVLDHTISQLATPSSPHHTPPLPHVALLDGVTMGGGVGLAAHAPFRVATEATGWAMPECAIGLFPDVGLTHALPRLPGGLGAWLALTGARLRGGDAVVACVATHYVPRSRVEGVVASLACVPRRGAMAAVAAILDGAAVPPPSGQLATDLPSIDAVFGDWADESVGVADFCARLTERAPTEPWAAHALQALRSDCPQSHALTLALLRAGKRSPSLGASLRLEFRAILTALCPGTDFVEGVSARLIDKRAPTWTGGCDAAAVTARLTPPAAREELELGDTAAGARPRL